MADPLLGHPYRTAPAAPRPPWWRRLLCALGLHLWVVRLALLVVLDGRVLAPDGYDCPGCGGRRVHLDHRLRPLAGCDCMDCQVHLTFARDPRLLAWQGLHALGPRSRRILLAHREASLDAWRARHLRGPDG